MSDNDFILFSEMLDSILTYKNTAEGLNLCPSVES